MDFYKKPIKQDIASIIDIYHHGVQLAKNLKEASNTRNRGLYKKHLLDFRVNQKRFKDKTNNLLSRLLSPVVLVKYSINHKNFSARLANITKEDVPILFELLSGIYRVEIKILEIEEITTYIKSSEL